MKQSQFILYVALYFFVFLLIGKYGQQLVKSFIGLNTPQYIYPLSILAALVESNNKGE